MSHPPTGEAIITLMSLSPLADSDRCTTDDYQALRSLSPQCESERVYIYLSKERDIYTNTPSLSAEKIATGESDAVPQDCGHLKIPQDGIKLSVIEPNVSQAEIDAYIAQAALDDAADAYALWQHHENQRLARERSLAFIATYRRQHGITPRVAISAFPPRCPSLVQIESNHHVIQAVAIQGSG